MATPFFGIGAMRAGTSWLYHLLKRHPDCSLPMKELHFFDTKYGLTSGNRMYLKRAQVLESWSKSASERLLRAVDKFSPESPEQEAGDDEEANEDEDGDKGGDLGDTAPASQRLPKWSDDMRQRFFRRARIDRYMGFISQTVDYLSIRDTSSYAEYLRRHSVGASAFGEITPDYALLPAEGFAEMDGLFSDARFIFVMRDPIDRLWSQVRYGQGKRKKGTRVRDPNVAFARALRGDNAAARSSYQQTIETLEAVVPRERILYFFYENLISQETGQGEIERLYDGLGLKRIELPSETIDTKRNPSPSLQLSGENEIAGLQRLAPAYQFIENRFGCVEGWRKLA